MASYQRVALFLLFDSIEQDLVRQVRKLPPEVIQLSPDERDKASRRIISRSDLNYDRESVVDLLHGLDIAEKFDVLMRAKSHLGSDERAYYLSLASSFKSIVPVRNAVMHARPLTIEEYARGFAFAQSLLRSRSYWPVLSENYLSFSKDPASFTSRSIEFLDDPGSGAVLHNLPTPEHDDTGFLPRPDLERELKKRILGRHPVVTILGEGGNGKTALALQCLYGLVSSNDHPFEAIIWTSAKTSMLTADGVKKIGDDIVSAMSIVEEASTYEPGDESASDRLMRLLATHQILLVIDNLETVQGDEIKKLSEDVPGNSKLLLTSRVPLGGDLSLNVGELSDKDAILYARRLFDAYEVRSLKNRDDPSLLRYMKRLHNKPLLIKWFVLGVKSGSTPESIVANPEVALRFCLENVIGRLGDAAKLGLVSLASITSPLSAQVLENVTDLDARSVELALSELARFGLVDLVTSTASEQLYRLRPFARAYAIRVMAPKAEVTATIRTRYAKIEAEFQSAKALTSYNPYSLKNFKIRSPAEMLAAAKLTRAVQSAMWGDFDVASQILEEARVTDPGYFEVHRAQAYVAYLQGDALTACTAYESAIELAPDEPQLHFFYGCMLMRGVDADAADEHFQKALDLDPDSLPIYREAARNSFVRADFERAEELLERSKKLGFKSHKDKVVYTDLVIQLYQRKLFHRIQARDWDSAVETIKDLAYFVYSLDLRIFDERMIDHLLSVLPCLSRLPENVIQDAPLALDLDNWIRSKFLRKSTRALMPPPASELGPAEGALKQAGRQATFGFLKADDGRETFVHEKDAGPDLWLWMLKEGRVSYEIVHDAAGRTRAQNLRQG